MFCTNAGDCCHLPPTQEMTWHPFALANKTILGLPLFGCSKQHACQTHMWPTVPSQSCWSPWELLCFTTINERLVEGQHTDEKNRVSVELSMYWLWVLRYSSKTWNAKKNSVEQFSKITTKKKKKIATGNNICFLQGSHCKWVHNTFQATKKVLSLAKSFCFPCNHFKEMLSFSTVVCIYINKDRREQWSQNITRRQYWLGIASFLD